MSRSEGPEPLACPNCRVGHSWTDYSDRGRCPNCEMDLSVLLDLGSEQAHRQELSR